MLLALAAVSQQASAQGPPEPTSPYLPWGMHIAYGNDPHSSMGVMWSTRAHTAGSYCQAGTAPDQLTQSFNGSSWLFEDLGNSQWLHRLNMTGFQAGTQYYYRCGDNAGNWSATFNFKTQPMDSDDYQPVIAIFGDFGIDVNAQSTLPWLYKDAAAGAFDVVAHIGDFAYDLDSNNGTNGDVFMRNIEQIAAHVPYHTCPGNHESANDFLEYSNRFNVMPGAGQSVPGSDSNFHSFNVGKLHFIMASSEVFFYFSEHGLALLPAEYAWLEQDLASVNRTATPWIVMGAHRPMYCSPNDDSDDCHSILSLMRDGIVGKYALESLMYKYGVEMFFGAHEHSVEINYPVYQFMWDKNKTNADAFVDFDRPIHILTGAAGCPENQDPWQPVGNPFSAARLNIYGYGRLHVKNETHLFWEVVDDSTGEAVYSMWIVKHTHGPYTGDLDQVPVETRAAAMRETLEFVRTKLPAATYDEEGKAVRRNSMGKKHKHDPNAFRHQLSDKKIRELAAANLAAIGITAEEAGL